MLDRRVASFSEPMALYSGGYGWLEQPIQGSLPSRGGALAGARLELVPRRSTLVVQAVFTPALGCHWSIRIVIDGTL